MARTRWFTHEVIINRQFLRLRPEVAAEFVKAEQAKFAAKAETTGPRGGRYILFGPMLAKPDFVSVPLGRHGEYEGYEVAFLAHREGRPVRQ